MSLKIVYHELVDLPDDSDPIEVLPECDSDLIVGHLHGTSACKNRLISRFGKRRAFRHQIFLSSVP